MTPIQEDYISFETAKLLKEKGFDEDKAKTAYSEDGKNSISPYSSFYDPYKYPIMDAPQWLVVKWLRVKHDIHITSSIFKSGNCGFSIWNIKKDNYELERVEYSTPEQATEVAIVYCLNNLI